MAALKDSATLEDGPFADHLHRVLLSVLHEPGIAAEVRRFLTGKPFEGPATKYHLWSSGLMTLEPKGEPAFRVPTYEAYLRTHLGSG